MNFKFLKTQFVWISSAFLLGASACGSTFYPVDVTPNSSRAQEDKNDVLTPSSLAESHNGVQKYTLSRIGAPQVLLTHQERLALGIKNGPDSPLAQYQDVNQRRFVVFSGLTTNRVRGTFRYEVNESLNTWKLPRSEFSLASQPEPILQPGKKDPVPLPLLNSSTYDEFDRDYAGGGTVIPCPDSSGKLLYFYHGENHTDPWGKTHRGPSLGWSGIGLALWNSEQSKFIKQHQILGVGVTNKWFGSALQPETKQGPPVVGFGNVVFNPKDKYFYLFHTDLTDAAQYKGAPYYCDRRVCLAVVRAPAKDVCNAAGTGRMAPWKKYWKGHFSSPALFVSPENAKSLPPGTGGDFSPVVQRYQRRGEVAPHVTYLEEIDRFVMVTILRPDNTFAFRFSMNGIDWQDPQVFAIENATSEYDYFYPYVFQREDDPLRLGLTFTAIHNEKKYQDAELIQVNFQIEPSF